MKLTAVVIAMNEEASIERCLRSLAGWCDEIVVIDSESKDHTVDIAKKFTDRVYVHPWRGYAEQKNFANSLASNDWILSVDADEAVGEELRKEIENLKPENFAAFSVPRKTIHFGRWIRHGGWYPNRLVRLFRKSQGSWVGGEVHEAWKTTGKIGALKNDLIHYSFTDLSDQVTRNDKYSSLAAVKLSREGKKSSLIRMMSKPASKFLETYFLKLGFLDGYPGLVISISASYSVFLKWAKLWEMQHVRQNS